MDEVDIAEVQGFATQARFYRQNDKDYVEISFIGNPDTLIHKVTPALMAQYRDQWNAYCDGVPLQQRKGTPLTALKEITEERAADFVRRNLHTLEELAALNDHQCQGLGHGVLTLRKQAQAIVAMRQFKEQEEAHKKITTAPLAVAPAASHHPEMQALQDIVAQQGEAISKIGSTLEQLTSLLAGNQRPLGKKKKNGAKQHPRDNQPSV